MKQEVSLTRVLFLLAIVCLAYATVMAGFSLYCWLWNYAAILDLRQFQLLMSPVGALVLLILVLTIILSRIPRIGAAIALVLFAFLTLGTLGLFLELLLDASMGFRIGLGRVLDSFGSLLIGPHQTILSTMSVLMVFFSVLCCLLLHPVFAEKKWTYGFGRFVAAFNVIWGFAQAIAFASGIALTYSDRNTLSITWLSALGYAALNLALLCLSGFDAWKPDSPGRHDASRHIIQLRRFERRLFVVVLLFAVGISIMGLGYLRKQQVLLRERVGDSLSAVADMKVQQILSWFAERQHDARFALDNPAFARDVAASFNNPGDQAARALLVRYLESLGGSFQYDRIGLYDTELREHLVYPGESLAIDASLAGVIRDCMRSGEVRFVDLHADAAQRVRMLLVTPISRPALGALVFSIDPEQYLFPLVQAWPAQTESAEILLGRREGSEVVFLNRLRFRSEKPLSFHLNLDEAKLPMAMAVRGAFGVSEGVDYRGVSVLTSLHPIPGFPWVLVAKIDQMEVFNPLGREAWSVTLLLCCLLTVCAFAAVQIWRKSSNAILAREKQVEQERQNLVERLALVTRHANDVMLITDADWCIIDANDRACEIYGYSNEELKGMSLRDLRSQESRPEFQLDAFNLKEKGQSFHECQHRRKDGSAFWAEMSNRLVDIEGRPCNLSIIRDITVRRAHEREINRLNLLYNALSQVNEMLARVNDQGALLTKACSILAKLGSFDLVWIGCCDFEKRKIKPVAWDGNADGYLQDVELNIDADSRFSLPTLVSLREGRGDYCRDFSEERVSPWRETMKRYGFCCSAAFPIKRGNSVWGNLTVYSGDPESLGDKERSLLEETAANLSFALDGIDTRAAHRRTELALSESELRFRSLFDSVSEAVSLHELVLDDAGNPSDYRTIECNPAFTRAYGVSKEQAQGSLMSALPSIGYTPYLPEFVAVALGAAPRSFEATLPRYERHYRLSVASPGYGRFTVIATDITQSKQAEETLRLSANLWTTTFDSVGDSIFVLDSEFLIQQCNRAALTLLRRPLHEVLGKSSCSLLYENEVPSETSRLLRVKDSLMRENAELEIHGRWYAATVDPVINEEGLFVGAVFLLGDITERKMAEAALRESESRFRRLTQAVTDYVYTVTVIDGKAANTEHGPGCAAVTGYSPEEFATDPFLWFRMVWGDDRPLVEEQVDQILRNVDPAPIEHRMIRKDGSVRWVRNTASVHRDLDGKLIAYDGLVTDITERKLAELRLREANEELQTINRTVASSSSSIELGAVLDNIMDHALEVSQLDAGMLCLLQPDGSAIPVAHRGFSTVGSDLLAAAQISPEADFYRTCTASGKPVFGVCASELTEGVPNRLVAAEQFCFHALFALSVQGKGIGVLCMFSREKNLPNERMLRLLEILSSPFALSLQNALLHQETLRYATQMEVLVKGRTAELEATNHELEAFSYSVSHDLRAPLRAIDGFTRIINEDYSELLDDEGRRLLGIVSSESQRMGRLIDDLLAFSRLGRHALHPEEVDISQLVLETRDELMSREADRKVKWTVGDLPRALGDPAFLRQVLLNLLGNAMKYSRNRDLAEIEISGSIRGTETVYCVKDNGAGFDMRYVSKLFGVFQRLHSDKEFEGNGVGLALVQRIIHRHGGRVWAEGKPGEGACFYFALPREPQAGT